MKQYLLKLIFAIIAIIIAYEFTIGKEIKKINQKANFILTKEGRKDGLEKIKKEMKRAIKKKHYLDNEEKELIKAFIKKIQSELK
jgi:hypothetical protein